MESLANVHHYQNHVHLSFNHRPSFARPVTSVSFLRNSSKSVTSIRASSNPISSKPDELHYSRHPIETLKPLASLLKTTCVALAATALFFNRFSKPSFAAPIAQPTVESAKITSETDSDEEKERTLEEYLESHPDDVKGLRSLMEVKIKANKLQQAISVIDRLIEVEPSEREWPLLKAQVQNYNGDVESAMLGFEEIISKDPLFVEAYHGLVMATSQSESGELGDVLKRIESAMEKCKKEKRKEDLRDFKLLVAQVKVIEGNYMVALKVYQELVKEEPRDFRPYLCQGIIYTLLQKKDEAEKQFQKYRRLVPKEHPYARYFDDNMLATKMFSQMAENQRTGSKS
ncbi:protein SLOW GREEN 1, chloroplastic-like isoform X1 [Macadamia integrifolia]|uniref:protein SLOW GREEN 1, chloroplastic-like isoform X1 n=1 Tax=Macadamia integrifolia TaxID=60698 RepID=UPI001C4F3882|nr:protein SLOW GREEN 1, chloroplastic-like isoform X1 [Macadamia integrifolia]